MNHTTPFKKYDFIWAGMRPGCCRFSYRDAYPCMPQSSHASLRNPSPISADVGNVKNTGSMKFLLTRKKTYFYAKRESRSILLQ